MRRIDGAYGEGGGQILRTALALSAITGDAVRVENIRANRSRPGLRPQHLTAVRAAAAICNAHLEGDHLNSTALTFVPQTPPQPGTYFFDVSDAAYGGSAGAVTLVAQTVLLPLAMASGPSRVVLRGGTAVPMSPPVPYLEHVYLPILAQMGVHARLTHCTWGFFPQGGGEVEIEIDGNATLNALDLTERGAPERVEGIAFAAKLPSHIPQRMSDRTRRVLGGAGIPHVTVEPQHVAARAVGAGIFLVARYAKSRAGFSALGRRGLPSEEVADDACRALLLHHHTGAAVAPHLADQLVLPFSLSPGTSRASISKITRHLLTNAWVVEQFDLPAFHVEGEEGQPGVLVGG